MSNLGWQRELNVWKSRLEYEPPVSFMTKGKIYSSFYLGVLIFGLR